MRFTSLAPLQRFETLAVVSPPLTRLSQTSSVSSLSRNVRDVLFIQRRTRMHARARALVECNPPIPFRWPTSCVLPNSFAPSHHLSLFNPNAESISSNNLQMKAKRLLK